MRLLELTLLCATCAAKSLLAVQGHELFHLGTIIDIMQEPK